MKKIDLYEIAIKITGFYFVVVLIEQLREVLLYASMLAQSRNDPSSFSGFNPTTFFLVALFCFLALAVFTAILIFKTRAVAKIVCSKEDSEQPITRFMNNKSVYEVAFLLIGLVTVILSLPDFIMHLKNYTKALGSLFRNATDTNVLLTGGLKILIGTLIVFYAKSLSLYFDKDIQASKDE